MQRQGWGQGPMRSAMQGPDVMQTGMQRQGLMRPSIQGPSPMRPANQSSFGNNQSHHVQRFQGPVQQNRFPPPEFPQWHGGFGSRGLNPQRFHGPSQNARDQFQARNTVFMIKSFNFEN